MTIALCLLLSAICGGLAGLLAGSAFRQIWPYTSRRDWWASITAFVAVSVALVVAA